MGHQENSYGWRNGREKLSDTYRHGNVGDGHCHWRHLGRVKRPFYVEVVTRSGDYARKEPECEEELRVCGTHSPR